MTDILACVGIATLYSGGIAVLLLSLIYINEKIKKNRK